MEGNKEPRKYSRRKNSKAASPSLPNSEAALNSSPSGKGVDSINIELSGIANIIKSKLEGNNFCMREHVARMREKDVRKCYPFPYDESEVDTAKLKQSLPPMVLPEKVQFGLSVDQSISNESPVTARLASVSISAAQCSDHQVPQIGDSHLEIEVLEGTAMSADESNILSNSEQHALLDGQKENNSEATNEAIIGHQMRSDANASDQIPEFRSASAAPAVTSVVIQEDPKNDCGPVHDEPASRNLKRLAKHSESSEIGESAAADSQQNNQRLRILRSATKVADKDLKGQPTPSNTLAASENSNISSSSSSFRRRKPPRMRLMRDIMADVNSFPRTPLDENQDAPNDTSHNASAEIVSPDPQAKVDNQTNEERLMPAEEVDISTQKASGKEIEKDAKTLRKMPAGKDSSFTGRLPLNGLMNRSWSCTRPRMPRRRTKGIIRSSLEPIQEDERENEDFPDDATGVSLSDHLVAKSAPTTCKRKVFSLLPLSVCNGGESNEPKKVEEPSRQMTNFGMPGMNDENGYIPQVDDGINIYKQQKGQVTHKRSNHQLSENPVNVLDTGILRLFGQQVSYKEMPKERNEVSNEAKSADCLSPLGENHFRLNSDGQSHIPFGMAEVAMSKGKAPIDTPSLRGSSNGLHEGILEHGSPHSRLQVPKGCDMPKHILDPNSEASLIWSSPTPMEWTNAYSMPKKVQASQPINMHMKNMMGDDNILDLNVPCLEAMQSDFIMEDSIRDIRESSYPWKKLEGSVNIFSNYTIPAMNLLRLMDASKLSSALPYNGSSYPLGTKLCHDDSDKNDLSTINILQNSSNWEKMKRSIYSAQEMATKSKGSTSKEVDECPQDSSIIPFQSSSQQSFQTLPDNMITGRPYIEENETAKKQKLQPADASGTSFALAEIPQPMTCALNRNPADFSVPEPGNPYMINGKYLKIGRARANKSGPGNGSNLKAASKKDRAPK